jgi:hypothetical protein
MISFQKNRQTIILRLISAVNLPLLQCGGFQSNLLLSAPIKSDVPWENKKEPNFIYGAAF